MQFSTKVGSNFARHVTTKFNNDQHLFFPTMAKPGNPLLVSASLWKTPSFLGSPKSRVMYLDPQVKLNIDCLPQPLVLNMCG